MRAAVVTSMLVAAAGCDRFDPPPPAGPDAVEAASGKARGAARDAAAAVMKAAEKAVATCVAGDLRWEPDPDGNPVPRHFSRPCIPERCATTAADVDAIRASARALRAIVDADPSLRVPSFLGFAALADAMVSFGDTALAGSAKESERPARLSGLSMHYGALATAHRELFPDAAFASEPPSLTASLAAPEAGGDPCKGWAMPKYCDVRGVRVPRERKWRSNPPCIEVQGIPK